MANYDTDILNQNIKLLMDNKDITQAKLADILGMSQSNVSKALSESDKKSFTFDQVVGIAKHFNVSIDMLVGNRHAVTASTGPRGIASFLSEIIANHDARFFPIQIDEDIFVAGYEPYQSAERKNRKITYSAIYFPSYWKLSDYGADKAEAYAKASQCGNETRMQPINTFLHQFKDIYDIYSSGDMSEGMYRLVLSDLLSHLRE